jgi:hypothetical protein
MFLLAILLPIKESMLSHCVLFCHVEISQTTMTIVAYFIVGKPLMNKGALRWFHND